MSPSWIQDALHLHDIQEGRMGWVFLIQNQREDKNEEYEEVTKLQKFAVCIVLADFIIYGNNMNYF